MYKANIVPNGRHLVILHWLNTGENTENNYQQILQLVLPFLSVLQLLK